jgi:hypothetical protein
VGPRAGVNPVMNRDAFCRCHISNQDFSVVDTITNCLHVLSHSGSLTRLHIPKIKPRVKAKAVSVIKYISRHKDVWEYGGMAMLFLNHGTGWKRLVKFTPRLLYSLQRVDGLVKPYRYPDHSVDENYLTT